MADPTSPPDSPQLPADDADKTREMTGSVLPDPAQQPAGQSSESGDAVSSQPSAAVQQPTGKQVEGGEVTGSSTPQSAQQGAPQALSPASDDRAKRFNAATIAAVGSCLAAFANVFIATLMYQSGAEWRSGLLSKVDEVTAEITSAKNQLEAGVKGQRAAIRGQQTAVATLEDAVTTLHDIRRILAITPRKVLKVTEVHLGARRLPEVSSGKFEVSEFANCPQLRINLDNPGGVSVGGTLEIRVQIGQRRFTCDEKKPIDQIQPGDDAYVTFNLGECFEKKGIGSCEGSGSLTVNVTPE